MLIRVFGKKDCKLCEAAKAKLKLFNLPFQDSVSLAEILTVEEFHKDEDLVTSIQAVYSDVDTMPIITIDRRAFEMRRN